MFTNDIKKGTRCLLRNGWFATMWDNMKGQTRVMDVEGFEHEAGSVYAHDIMFVINPDGTKILVEHTPKQLQLKEMVRKHFS